MSNSKKIVKTIKLTQEEWIEFNAILDNGLDDGFYADGWVDGPEQTKAYNSLMKKLDREEYVINEGE